MKVYIHFLMVAFFSIVMIGCTEEKMKVDYSINGSGGMSNVSGSIVLDKSIKIAYVNQFSGSVMIDDVNITKGTILHENSVLVTGSDSEAEIIFADNSIVRISENSRLQISKKGTDNTTLDLQEGTLWARVLKPFTDMSFFTLETDDLSAGVRGTSVWLLTDSGGTDIGVIDTTAVSGGSSGALIEINDKKYFGGGNIYLSQENILSVRGSKPLERKKMKLEEIMKSHPFIEKNTIQDIRYMNALIGDPTLQMNARGRIQMEMNVTMPSSTEVIIFLTDPVIRSEIKKQNNSEMTPDEFIRYLDINQKIEEITNSKLSEADKKQAIENARKGISGISTVPTISTGSTGAIILPPIIKKPTTVISMPRTTSSVVSGEKLPCRVIVSGEPCK